MAEEASSAGSSACTTTEFALNVGGATLRATVQLPTGRTTLTELLPILRAVENAIGDQVAAEAEAAGRPISCRAGCGACCRQLVPLSLFEAEAMTEWLKTLPEERQERLRQRFHEALSGLRDAGIIDRIVDGKWMNDEATNTRLNRDYFYAGVACPFLEDESCSIHPMRPLSCREYLVTSSPELCKDPGANAIAGVPLPVKMSKTLFAFGRHVERDQRGWIPLVFLPGWEKSGGKPGNFVAGSGPEVLQLFLRELEAHTTDKEEQA
jgi:Fe-S-cluster containining protein